MSGAVEISNRNPIESRACERKLVLIVLLYSRNAGSFGYYLIDVASRWFSRCKRTLKESVDNWIILYGKM
jgi:hypothetical protein